MIKKKWVPKQPKSPPPLNLDRSMDAEIQHLDLYGKYAHSTGFDLSGLARYTRVVAECGAVR
jgi:hypothetical protein